MLRSKPNWARDTGNSTSESSDFDFIGRKRNPDLGLSFSPSPWDAWKGSLASKPYQTNCLSQIAKKKDYREKRHMDGWWKGEKQIGFCSPLNGPSGPHFCGSLNTHPYGSCQCSQSLPASDTKVPFYNHHGEHWLASKACLVSEGKISLHKASPQE